MLTPAAPGLFGVSVEAWLDICTGALALFTLILAGATISLVFIGRRQILSIREEAKQERTLSFCHKYDSEIVLDQALRRLGAAREAGSLSKNSENKADAASILNYLDALAVGIAQCLYIEELARDHMEPIVLTHVRQFLSDEAPDLGLRKENYAVLLAMASRWSNPAKPAPETLYRDNDRRRARK